VNILKNAYKECLRSTTWEFGPNRYILKVSMLFDNLTSIEILPEMVNEAFVLNTHHFEIDAILGI
jgi:hypothetical protein